MSGREVKMCNIKSGIIIHSDRGNSEAVINNVVQFFASNKTCQKEGDRKTHMKLIRVVTMTALQRLLSQNKANLCTHNFKSLKNIAVLTHFRKITKTERR